MWRLDRKTEDDDATSIIADDDALNPRTTTAPHTLSLGDPGLVAGNIAEPVWTRWRDEIAAIGGDSPLLHFEDGPRTRIELSTTHPGGLPQFITGQSTLLSSLIRDELALRTARAAAERDHARRASSCARCAASSRCTWRSASPSGGTAPTSTSRRSCCARSPSAATAATSS